MMKLRNVIIPFFTILAILASIFVYFTVDYNGPIEFRVVDANTGKPIEGVIAVASWPMFGLASPGFKIGTAEVKETMSDHEGMVHFPSWGPVFHHKGRVVTGRGPLLYLYKYKYRDIMFYRHLGKVYYRSKREREDNRFNQGYVELEPFVGSGREYLENTGVIFNVTTDVLEHNEINNPCMWKKLPHTMVLAHKKEIMISNIRPPIPPGLPRIKTLYERIESLGCGRPEDIFPVNILEENMIPENILEVQLQ
jgi:hypothetical protein